MPVNALSHWLLTVELLKLRQQTWAELQSATLSRNRKVLSDGQLPPLDVATRANNGNRSHAVDCSAGCGRGNRCYPRRGRRGPCADCCTRRAVECARAGCARSDRCHAGCTTSYQARSVAGGPDRDIILL